MEPLQSLRDLLQSLRGLDSSLRRLSPRQRTTQPSRDSARSTVDYYFRVFRPLALQCGLDIVLLEAPDHAMQYLLDVTNRSSLVSTLREALGELTSALGVLEKDILLLPVSTSSSGPDAIDRLIISTLEALVPSAALSYEQAVTDLVAEERLSWRGPSTDLRESLRETLDHLAPDDEVTAQAWYVLEPDTHGPTMRQKVRHILQKRGLSRKAAEGPETAAAAIDELVGSFVRATYTRSSISTHTPRDKAEALRVRDWVRLALCEILAIRV